METYVTSLTDLELLRQARSSVLMEDPLFAEFVARFETRTTHSNTNELDGRVYTYRDSYEGRRFCD